jgi:glucosyl-3-phosphoglycerate synthase
MAVRDFTVTASLTSQARLAKATTSVSVCIPCRNEATTIGPIVRQIVDELMEGPSPTVDELLVLDDGSTDDTASVAAAAGAKVVAVTDVLPEAGPGHGKGNALWKSVAASAGELIVWCDGDLESFTSDYVRSLILPLLVDPSVMMVKGYYDRPIDGNGQGGGRTTELVARPLLALLFQQLSMIKQPLGGEYAARREVLEQVQFVQGYGVEIALLLDIAELAGPLSIAQMDLGVRRHRHRSLRELSAQSAEIMHAVLVRAGLSPAALSEFSGITVNVAERPALASTRGYRTSVLPTSVLPTSDVAS